MAKTKSIYLMKTFLLKSVLPVAAFVSVIACSDKKGTPKSNTEILSQASWKFESEGLDLDKNGTIDMPSGEVEDCTKDDILTFAANGTGTRDEGTSKCEGTDPQTSSFNWQFKNSEKELSVDIPIFQGRSFNLHTLNDASLKAYVDIDTLGTSIRAWVTLKH